MKIAKPVSQLIESLQRLPGIGPRSAERLAYHLLRMSDTDVFEIAQRLRNLKENTAICQICFNIAESEVCQVCDDPSRNQRLIFVAEEPLDVIALERTNRYDGVYHVLGGVIDPVRGIGAEELRVRELVNRIGQLLDEGDVEMIMGMNPSTEGETTAIYLKKIINQQFDGAPVRLTRIARGLPIGGDLEYADPMTLSRSLEGRGEY